MKICHFTIAENYVITSAEEIIYYVDIATDIGREKKSRVVRRLLILFYDCVTICIFVLNSGDHHIIISLLLLDSIAVILFFLFRLQNEF
jgi:hypothetical protein